MKKLILVSLAILSLESMACYNDYECGYGKKCVKASGDFNVTGICVTPTDQYGNQDYSNKDWGKTQPTTVKSCQFDTQCGIGESCMKRSGSLNGICMK